jgi:KDO2-lipid IV(A) lauroyltransferase
MNDIRSVIKNLRPTFAGRLLCYFFPFRKKISKKNIDVVFGNVLSKNEKSKLLLAFYSHLATSLKENFLLRFYSLKKLKSKAKVIGMEYVLKAAEKNKGILILSGHFGNWEFSPIAGILNFPEYQHRFHFIRKTLGNKFIERILFRRYYQAGLTVIPKKNSLNQVCDVLEKNDAVVFIMDQHASLSSKDGIAVNFFGKPAGTFRSLAMIAQYTQAPVVAATSYRDNDGNHILEFFPELTWIKNENTKQEIFENTLHYNKKLEELVLLHPEQWLWLHRRWKI